MQQKAKQKKVTQYGSQLQEKQSLRNSYGIREAQFRRYYKIAAKFKGQTGIVLLTLLERRLDNSIFKAGFAKSKAHARQLIAHRHITVNGKRVSTPSQLVEVNDTIAAYKSDSLELFSENKPPSWMSVDKKNKTILIKRLPESDELPIEFDTQKIIEFYSR